MKRKYVCLIILICFALLLGACSADAPNTSDISSVAGSYVLESAEYYRADELIESYTAREGEDPLLALKLKDDGNYLIRFGSEASHGTATLEDNILTLTGDPSLFGRFGNAKSMKVDFSDGAIMTVELEREGVTGRLIVRMVKASDLDDSYFEGDGPVNVERPEDDSSTTVTYIGVRGLKEQKYLPREFSSDAITVGFKIEGFAISEERWLTLSELEHSVMENGDIGEVIGTYLDVPFSFFFGINQIDLAAIFPDKEVEYTAEAITHLPTLPDGCTFVPDGEYSFVDAGRYTVSGTVYVAGAEYGSVSSELWIKKRVVTDYPSEISFRKTADGSMPDGLIGEMFEINATYFDVGSFSATLTLKSSNHCFADGSNSTSITVTVLPPVISASELVWHIPKEKIEFSSSWREAMPYLTYLGSKTDGVRYNYSSVEGGTVLDGFQIGDYTVNADLSGLPFEVEGDATPCTVEIVPLVLPLPSVTEYEYEGSDIVLIYDFIYHGYADISGYTSARGVGEYSCTITVYDDLFNTGAVLLPENRQSVEVEWSIVKKKIDITVDASAFDRGFNFSWDGVERYFRAENDYDAEMSIYINGVHFPYGNPWVINVADTYNVRILVEDDEYTSDPYVVTVKIDPIPITLSELGIEWEDDIDFVYYKHPYYKHLKESNIPYFIEINYEGDSHTDVGEYRTVASFSIKESLYPECKNYYIADPEFTMTHDWEIKPCVVRTPQLIDGKHYAYTGEEIVYFRKDGHIDLGVDVTVSGDRGTRAGQYTLTLTLGENYIFSDGTRHYTRSWYIDGNSIDFGRVALVDNWFEWSFGERITPSVWNLDNVARYFDYEVTGDTFGIEPGVYSGKYIFTKNSQYKDDPNYLFSVNGSQVVGNSFEISYTFEINKRFVDAPIVSGSYIYTGSVITPTLKYLDTDLVTVSYPDARDAGEHFVTVTLKDAAHYYLCDDDGECSSLKIGFSIGKATLSEIPYTAPITVFDGVGYIPTPMYAGVGGEQFAASYTLTEDSVSVDRIYGAGKYVLKVTTAAGDAWMKNYETPSGWRAEFTVSRADIDPATLQWEYDEVIFNENRNIPALLGLPTGVDVKIVMAANSQGNGCDVSDACIVKATITGANYNELVLTHTYKVLPRKAEIPTLIDGGFVYNGGEHTQQYISEDAYLLSTVEVYGSKAVNAGVHEIVLIVNDNLYFEVDGERVSELSFEWYIAKADYDVSDVKWNVPNGSSYPYDGTEYSFNLLGLPAGLRATYSRYKVGGIGDFEMVATLINDNAANYNDPVVPEEKLKLSFTLTPLELGCYSYYVAGGYVYVVGYSGNSETVVLPDFGYSVWSVGDAFAGHGEIVSLNLSSVHKIEAGALVGLANIEELWVPFLGDGVKLSSLFGGTVPDALYELHASAASTIDAFYVNCFDAPGIKELYLSAGSYIDFSDVPFELDFLSFHASSYQCLILNFDYLDSSLPVVHVGGTPLSFGSGHYKQGYIVFESAQLASVTYSSGVPVEINGNVYAFDTQSNTATLVYSRNTGDVVVPDSVVIGGLKYTVSAIGAAAFGGRVDLTSVALPDTVKLIEHHAFYGCTALASIDMGSGVEKIGASTIKGCNSIVDISYSGGGNWRDTTYGEVLDFSSSEERIYALGKPLGGQYLVRE